MDLSKFHVITMISNPVRYKSRYTLYRQFKQHMEDAGVNFWTCELAFGARPFAITEAGDPHALQLRTSTELWHKENALNKMVERLPPDWKYVAFVDADIAFDNWRGPDAWYLETLHALQHHQIVQLFQTAIDYDPKGNVIKGGVHTGFAYAYVSGMKYGSSYTHWHPGFAWAMRRSAWDAMGGLIDFGVLGAADNHMAHAWIGRVLEGVNKDVSKAYTDRLLMYQEQCERYIRRDIGYVHGTIRHYWHGKKKDRKYWDRWKILTETKFDPNADMKRDWQGLWQLCDHGDARSIILRDKIREYFRARNEDSIDLE
jgi:hypothetical protein